MEEGASARWARSWCPVSELRKSRPVENDIFARHLIGMQPDVVIASEKRPEM